MKMLFNSSMPRAGSELLQVLLHQNPAIYASPTSPLLEFQFGARQMFELAEVQSQPKELMFEAFSNLCRSMTQGYYSEITNRENVIDKSRGWIFYWDWVEQWNPEPKMVCMVRDLRDILCSMERIWQENRHRPIGPDNPSEMQSLTFEGRCQHWLTTPPIGLALARVKESRRRKLPILYLRYEDLVSQPQATLDCWYDHVGLSPFQHTFDNVVKTVDENTELFGPYGNHDVKLEVKPPTETWRDMMTLEMGDEIKMANRWYFETFNY